VPSRPYETKGSTTTYRQHRQQLRPAGCRASEASAPVDLSNASWYYPHAPVETREPHGVLRTRLRTTVALGMPDPALSQLAWPTLTRRGVEHSDSWPYAHNSKVAA
jgi:hypothetical protein